MRKSNAGVHLCSELVALEWRNSTTEVRTTTANLEEIWDRGATLLVEAALPLHLPLTLVCNGFSVSGYVSRCRYDYLGYFVRIHFTGGFRWSPEVFTPDHMFAIPDQWVRRGEPREKPKVMAAGACWVG